MRQVIHHAGALDEDQITALARAYDGSRVDAVRRAVAGSYRQVLRTHPAVDPARLLVDVTDVPGGVRWVIHDGHHIPSVLSAPYTRRHRAADFVSGRQGGVV